LWTPVLDLRENIAAAKPTKGFSVTTDSRSDWTIAEVEEIINTPLLDLVAQAQQVHRVHHDPQVVRVNQLISIKTGGCPEDCAYCSQSVHNNSGVKPKPLMSTSEVVAIAMRARDNGASRVCLGAAWREVRDNRQFERVLDIVREVTALGVEVCCTLGMLTADQAERLDDAGLYAYNHNIDTSPEYYETVITTRSYQERIDTIEHLRNTNITLCCGGIIGMGESITDRIGFLHALATLEPHPDSVPINVLSKVEGTPLADQPDVPIDETVRVIATARILMPNSVVRLAAGRHRLSFSDQALCFLAGANSIFSSENNFMLTEAVPCTDHSSDRHLLDTLGLRAKVPAGAARHREASVSIRTSDMIGAQPLARKGT
jgi:biotin synthase